jgi:hypothetical protein
MNERMTRFEAKKRADIHGLWDEVVHSHDKDGMSWWEACKEWDVLWIDDYKPDVLKTKETEPMEESFEGMEVDEAAIMEEEFQDSPDDYDEEALY